MALIPNPKEIASGAVLIGIGGFFALAGRKLPVANVGHMGPGYFPLVLSCLLILFGVIVLVNSVRGGGSPIGPVPWRGMLMLVIAFMGFGAIVKPLGLGLALTVAVFVASLASHRWRLVPSLLLTAAMVLFGWAVFIRGLGLPVRFLGTWFH